MEFAYPDFTFARGDAKQDKYIMPPFEKLVAAQKRKEKKKSSIEHPCFDEKILGLRFC
jgi:hypothetical protein